MRKPHSVLHLCGSFATGSPARAEVDRKLLQRRRILADGINGSNADNDRLGRNANRGCSGAAASLDQAPRLRQHTRAPAVCRADEKGRTGRICAEGLKSALKVAWATPQTHPRSG